MKNVTNAEKIKTRLWFVCVFLLATFAIAVFLAGNNAGAERKRAEIEVSRAVELQDDATLFPEVAPSQRRGKAVGHSSADEADNASLIHDLLNKEHCYSRNGEAVMENPDSTMNQEVNEREFIDLQQRMASIADSLILSTDGDHVFAAAILGQSSGGRYELYDRANLMDPENRVYHFYQASHCMRKDATCSLDSVLNDLVRVDADNSEALLLRAINRYKTDNPDLALNDLQMAATLPRTESYFADLVLLLEQAFSAAGMGFSERAGLAFGIAASSIPPYGELSQMCVKMSESDENWKSACVNYLERAEQQASTEIGYAIALGVLNQIVQSGSDSRKQAEVASRYAAYQKRSKARLRETMNADFDNEFYLFESPRVFNDYLNHMKAHGEQSAQKFYDEEVKRLKASGWLSPCEVKRRAEASAD